MSKKKSGSTWKEIIENRAWCVRKACRNFMEAWLTLGENTNYKNIIVGNNTIAGDILHRTHLDSFEIQLDANLNKTELKRSLAFIAEHYMFVQGELQKAKFAELE